MTDVDVLIRRIDDELRADVQHEKAAWADAAQMARERGPRLQRFEAAAQHIIDQLKPLLAAFIERFQAVSRPSPASANTPGP